jgi:nitronate monooxygenase
MDFPALEHPIIQAPLAGGPSTPELAAAVSNAGGLGFIAAGYRTAEQLLEDIVTTRELTEAPFGVNIFYLSRTDVDGELLAAYAERLGPEAERQGARLGEARYEDDAFDEKVAVVAQERIPIVSFTFGCPPREVFDVLHGRGSAVWVTVTDVNEALTAERAGADALVAQGIEAGGHRGSFDDAAGGGDLALIVLLRLIAHASDLPLVGAGGIADGAGIAAALAAGARAAQIGTGFLRSAEAGTSAPHREALARPGVTAVTRAFTGRRARGIVNRFLVDHDVEAPSAYPHIHHMTAPLRAAARAAGNTDAINLWAGQAYQLALELPAAELVRIWSSEAREALEEARRTLGD